MVDHPLLTPSLDAIDPPEQDDERRLRVKETEVLQACEAGNLDALRALATTPGGLICDTARQSAWPILLGCKPTKLDDSIPWQRLPRHKDEDQVALDVDRAFVYYPKDDSEKRKDLRKSQLSDLIIEVLRRHPFLNYFQGYHDIAQVFLLVLGASIAVPAVERLSLLRIRDFMLPSMTASLSHLSLLPSILAEADPKLHQHLLQTAPFYFALPATLTLYAHDIQEYGDIARLFDYLLAREAVISVYLFAIVICSRKDQLLELESDEHDMLHATLSKLPKPLDLDALINKTDSLFVNHPPDTLRGRAWRNMSNNSVLKTTRPPDRLLQQTLGQGESYFRQYASEVQRRDARSASLQQMYRLSKRYQKPTIFVTSSILIVLAALYLAKDSTHNPATSSWAVWRLEQIAVRPTSTMRQTFA